MHHIFFITALLWTVTAFSAADDMSLWQEEHVMTNSWKKIKAHATQEKKDEMLFNLVENSPDRRQAIAAAVHAGANIAQVQKMLQAAHSRRSRRLLPPVVYNNEILWAAFLLEHGANVHERDPVLGTAIRLIKKVPMAELLIKHGALEQLTSAEKIDIFGKVMHDDASPELIPLLKQHQFDPTTIDYFGWNVLMYLTLYPWQDMVYKAALIFEGMQEDEIKKLINVKAFDGKTVFTRIDYESQGRLAETKSRLEAYRTFLLQKRDGIIQEIKASKPQDDESQCSICFDALQSQPCRKIACGHEFHQVCLGIWLNSSSTCPLCRANVK